MQVKRFVASTLQEAILKVKKEMGKDAVILHTRKFKEGGIFGFFSKEMVEVTAALDNSPLTVIEPKLPSRPEITTPNPSSPRQQQKDEASVNDQVGHINDYKELSLVREELRDMKHLMNRVLKGVEFRQRNGLENYPPGFGQIFDYLCSRDIEEELARRLVKAMANQLLASDLDNKPKIQECLDKLVCDLFQEPLPIQLSSRERPQVVSLVGPTGVGKTTTIAKLAARYSLIEKKRLALITIDTYRIAAIEQLKTYGKIMDIPVEVVFTPEILRETIEQFKDKELILLDTAGRSPQNDTHMKELNIFLNQKNISENYLVISAGTRYRDMLNIYKSFSNVVSIDKLIFTKLDETEYLGPLLSLVTYTRKNLSYVTTGQNVPDDIEVPSPRRLARMIVGEIGENKI
ncbi:MAG: flagellar biosynthesis protein FlhF [Bacillota bacterium]|jgi:flagellar biosynthesis protein FlhF